MFGAKVVVTTNRKTMMKKTDPASNPAPTTKLQDLLAAHPAHQVKVAVVDIDGVLRGKWMAKEKLLKALDEGFGFCNVVFGWDINDQPYDNTDLSGWHTGYPDALAMPDPATFRTIPWQDGLPFLLADFSQSPEIADACPRSLLKKIRQQALDSGFAARFSNEFEWFNFRETPQSFKEKNGLNPQPVTPGMFGYSLLRASQNHAFFTEIFDGLLGFGVPLEGLHTETGDGVYEAAIEHSDVLEAADRGVLFKAGVKEIAHRHGIMASFMAKWNSALPGCSGHIHQSLWDLGKACSLFFDAEKPGCMSRLMEQYLAGQLHCLPYILPMFAPTVNSYKRLVAGSWASVSVSWGIENRTTAIRVINQNAGAMRIETRTPGSDANPYLSMAACLASGLYGIRHQLALETPPTKGNEYENMASRRLPATLAEAVSAMRASPIANELFGAGFVDHFLKTRDWEWRQFSQKVTDWELRRYFESV